MAISHQTQGTFALFHQSCDFCLNPCLSPSAGVSSYTGLQMPMKKLFVSLACNREASFTQKPSYTISKMPFLIISLTHMPFSPGKVEQKPKQSPVLNV